MVATVDVLITEEVIANRLYLRPRESAQVTGLSESEIYRSIYRGRLRAMKYRGRRWLVTRADMEAWIADQSEPNVA